jgi:methylglyoxal synthase
MVVIDRSGVVPMEKTKTIALVAHDNRKRDLKEWVEFNYRTLVGHDLVCTGTTGRLVEETIERKFRQDGIAREALKMRKLKSGPLGGDLQLGGMIAEGKIDFVIFFWDPMEPFPHDVDVKALLRVAVLYNIPMACNRSTADFMISSPLMNEPYQPVTKDYSDYLNRKLPG